DDRFLLTLEYASGGKIVGKNNIKPIEEAKIGQISSREICFASDSMLYYPEHPEKRFMFISGGMNLEKAVETATRYCKRKL
ncbi:MAG: hypothetical protein IIX11_05690, partial [Selenomonadales bacterium]|nr:hypothetical protein [Selenomonadales bacterium]